ncbi:MAG: hypothetical protein Terrestrivirus4_192 [Terrestrivirus sp.]|uniref:N-acetyltransferase domain-containing protein n=1 Tax=Terrestrivirus sp. TaxID=2487775 RepID=A0A3G4ZP25_9VIRU|nr:MAG: hypothetical protein Terrestrivirus4_192 [Terrestrivirus sp.]
MKDSYKNNLHQYIYLTNNVKMATNNTLAKNESEDSIKRVIITSNNVINTLIENESEDSIKRVIITSNNVINTLAENESEDSIKRVIITSNNVINTFRGHQIPVMNKIMNYIKLCDDAISQSDRINIIIQMHEFIKINKHIFYEDDLSYYFKIFHTKLHEMAYNPGIIDGIRNRINFDDYTKSFCPDYINKKETVKYLVTTCLYTEEELSQNVFYIKNRELLDKCAALFSNNYGCWNTGARIELNTLNLVEKYIFNNKCGLITAIIDEVENDHKIYTDSSYITFPNYPYDKKCPSFLIPQPKNETIKRLVGYLFYCTVLTDMGNICLITQLVVEKNYQHKKIAQRMINHLIKYNKMGGFCIVSSNPYAIIALEKSLGYTTRPDVVMRHGPKVLKSNDCIPHLKNKQLNGCLVNTEFHITQNSNEKIQHELNWKLGYLSEGHEFMSIVLTKYVS